MEEISFNLCNTNKDGECASYYFCQIMVHAGCLR